MAAKVVCVSAQCEGTQPEHSASNFIQRPREQQHSGMNDLWLGMTSSLLFAIQQCLSCLLGTAAAHHCPVCQIILGSIQEPATGNGKQPVDCSHWEDGFDFITLFKKEGAPVMQV